MRLVPVGMILLKLAGCGAAGEPLRPTANLGLSIGTNGVTPSASVGATNGPLSVNLNL